MLIPPCMQILLALVDLCVMEEHLVVCSLLNVVVVLLSDFFFQ